MSLPPPPKVQKPTVVDGLSTDFRSHGYPSSKSWIRYAGESLKIEDNAAGAPSHPNAAGHRAIGRRLLVAYDQVLASR